MMFPGMILMGAQSRLLPPSVPFRFFLSALVFHILSWAALALDAGQVPQFFGGPGWILAGIHALTLGVLVMTTIGASFQILPVVTGQALAALWLCKLVFWLYVPGTAVLVSGFVLADPTLMTAGAVLAAMGLTVFALLMADVLRRTHGMRTLVLHGWASLAALVLLAAFGVLLVFNMEHGFLPDSGRMAVAHVVVAVYGFMGMLVFGYSQFMVPMFAMGPSPQERQVVIAFTLFAGGILAAVGAAFAGSTPGLVVSAALALAGAVLHVRTMAGVLREGMRKQLGLSFVLVKAAWVFLGLGIVVGAAAAAELDDRLVPAFGVVVLIGWLLTFLMGILQRIIPFLAAMNAAKAGQKPPTLSELSIDAPLKIHAVGHFGALGLVLLGIVLDRGEPVAAGAVAGMVGGTALLWFALGTIRRMRAYGGTAAAQAGSDEKQ